MYSTGNMAVALVIFSNQAAFGSTDHISSAWLHSMPIVTAWAIRWKELIYSESILKAVTFNLLSSNEMLLTSNEERIRLMVINPILFWLSWATYYVIIFYIGFNGYIEDDRYPSGLDDFKKMGLKAICGDPEHNTKAKYLLQHLLLFLLSLPLAYISYHNFIFNTCYILVLMIIIMMNAGTQQAKILENKLQKKIEKENNLVKLEA